jgi:DNA-binding transcriptional regulator YbjK
MPYAPEHKAEIRTRILDSARRLFNRNGLAAVSIDEIMAGAGLTRGGFYSYFDSKEDLRGSDHAFHQWRTERRVAAHGVRGPAGGAGTGARDPRRLPFSRPPR